MGGLSVRMRHVLRLCFRRYDLRSSRPLLHKQHQYELPVHSLAYHTTRDASLVMSVDSKIVKMWHRDSGDSFCNIETVAPSEDLAINPNSGMIFLAGQQVRRRFCLDSRM